VRASPGVFITKLILIFIEDISRVGSFDGPLAGHLPRLRAVTQRWLTESSKTNPRPSWSQQAAFAWRRLGMLFSQEQNGCVWDSPPRQDAGGGAWARRFAWTRRTRTEIRPGPKRI